MERYGIDRVPRVLGVDAGAGFALLSWLDGVAPGAPGDADIDAAAGFLAAIHALSDKPEAARTTARG